MNLEKSVPFTENICGPGPTCDAAATITDTFIITSGSSRMLSAIDEGEKGWSRDGKSTESVVKRRSSASMDDVMIEPRRRRGVR